MEFSISTRNIKKSNQHSFASAGLEEWKNSPAPDVCMYHHAPGLKAFFFFSQISQFPRRHTSVDWWRSFLVTPVQLFLRSLAAITQSLLRKKNGLFILFTDITHLSLLCTPMGCEMKWKMSRLLRGEKTNKQANILSSKARQGTLNIRLHFSIKWPINPS